jgi:hypothetical protein
MGHLDLAREPGPPLRFRPGYENEWPFRQEASADVQTMDIIQAREPPPRPQPIRTGLRRMVDFARAWLAAEPPKHTYGSMTDSRVRGYDDT